MLTGRAVRPRPVWRATPRSALGSPAYAPAAHLVRRATFVAAGLELAAPVADMSALGVETRALRDGAAYLTLGAIAPADGGGSVVRIPL